MAVTKKSIKHYEKVKKHLRVGSEVSVRGSIGRVLSINVYPATKYDYRTASVRFYNKELKSRNYSIGSLELRSHHRENLYTRLTGKAISDKNLVDFCVGLQQLDSLKQYGGLIENYYLKNRSKKKTARRLKISVDDVRKLKSEFIRVVREYNYDMLVLSGLPISLDTPIECRIDNPVTVDYLKRRGKFTLNDIKKLKRPDLFKGIDKAERDAIEMLWKELNNI